MTGIGTLSAALLCVLGSVALADSPVPAPTPAQEAQIPFANQGGIYNWQVVDDRTVLIEDRNRKWYKATLLSPCFELPFAQRLGFESNNDGSFDKFSLIQVRKQKCPLVSLVSTAPPAKRSKSKKSDATAAASSAPPAAVVAPANPEK
jgi:hypothetical protein